MNLSEFYKNSDTELRVALGDLNKNYVILDEYVAGQYAIPVVIPTGITIVPSKSAHAATTAVLVSQASVVLLPANSARNGLIVQTMDPVLVRLDGSASSALYSYAVPRNSVLELENYSGSVEACTLSGTTTVFVTEKF